MVKNYFHLIIFAFLIISCQDDDTMVDAPVNGRQDYILAGETGAGIFNHNLNPDWEAYAYGIASNSINIDINGDFLKDVCILYSTISSANGYTVQTIAFCLSGASISLEPKLATDSINQFSSWSSSPSVLGFTKIDFSANDTSSSGAWIATDNKFLGVKINKNGLNTYGWIKMSLLVHPATVYVQKIIVSEFACQKLH